MLIRPAKSSDASSIARAIMMAEGMDMVSYVTGFGDAERAEEKLTGWILSPVPNRYSLQHALVAEIDGRIAGTVISFPADSQPGLDTIILEDINRRGVELKVLFFEGIPGTYYLSIMGVEPERRKQGVGTALMTAAREGAKNRGFARASLLVEQDRPRVMALYERQGFRAAEEVVLAQFRYWRMAADL